MYMSHFFIWAQFCYATRVCLMATHFKNNPSLIWLSFRKRLWLFNSQKLTWNKQKNSWFIDFMKLKQDWKFRNSSVQGGRDAENKHHFTQKSPRPPLTRLSFVSHQSQLINSFKCSGHRLIRQTSGSNFLRVNLRS